MELDDAVPLDRIVAGYTVGMALIKCSELGLLEIRRQFGSAGCFCGLLLCWHISVA